MSSRKLQVSEVSVENKRLDPENEQSKEYSIVMIRFSRKLTQLEVSGVKAVLQGEIG